jgi:hypothetical protein
MFFQKPFFKTFFITSILIAVLHYISLEYFLYWTVYWFDIMMHFLGGFLISIFSIFILYSYSDFENLKKHKIFLITLIMGTTLSVGLGWELWEVFVGFTDTVKDLNDTIIDIIMDMIGSVFAIYYARKEIYGKQER